MPRRTQRGGQKNGFLRHPVASALIRESLVDESLSKSESGRSTPTVASAAAFDPLRRLHPRPRACKGL
jgi:hypothetical protein